MNKNIFVVGTGRCGSTMLSNMFRESDKVLSLSEFFAFVSDLGTLIGSCFPDEEVDATYFWNLIGYPHEKQNLMLRHDIAMKEVLYQISPDSKFNLKTGVPAIMQTTLPHISGDADGLFDELKDYILSLPKATISHFYKALFTWLCQKFNKTIWLERTGGSLRIVKRLHDNFPEAKFIHIVRDGRSCCLSMEQHYGFRFVLIIYQLIEILGVDPFLDEDRTWINDLSDDVACFLPENFDSESFKNYKMSPSLYGHYWSGEIAQGLEEFALIPQDQKLTIKYEDILNEPQKIMTQIADFVGNELVGENWVKDVVSQIKVPKSKFDLLSVHEQDLLMKACAPGFEALQKHGIEYL